jgi:hypothetical protein
VQIRVEVDEAQLKAFRAELRAIRSAGEDPRPAFAQVIEDFLGMEKAVFTTQGASIGPRWAPIGARSAGTRGFSRTSKKGRVSKKVYRNPHPLQLTRALYRSLTQPRARYAIRRVSMDGVTLGTRDPVAHLHDLGTRKKLPQRRLMDIDRRVEDRWLGYVEDYLFGDDSRGRGRRGLM